MLLLLPLVLLFHFRYTGVSLELISDPGMYLMIESAIRGGLAMVPRKWAKANNRYLTTTTPATTTSKTTTSKTTTSTTTKDKSGASTGAGVAAGAGAGAGAVYDYGYDPDKPTSYIMHYDANNMYGYAMSQKLPFGGHRWLKRKEIDDLKIPDLADDEETGYIFEVDLDYPQELHEQHSDFPLAPERMTITVQQWSPYTRKLAESLNIPLKNRGERLVATLYNKRNYVVHYRCLKLYLRLGLKLVRIHRAVSFKQSFWLQKYIALNTDKRRQATDEFDKDLYKFMNNAVFGKTLENVRKYIDMELVNDSSELVKLTKGKEFVKAQVITPDLVSVHSKLKKVKLYKPIYVGFAVLDLSKQLLYEFHYDVVKAQYGERATLCYTDTDSLLYHIETDDIYEDMTASAEHYDTSNFPRNHHAYSTQNERVPGKMKDENAGNPIAEFVGLRAKMYSCKMASGADKKTAKGVSEAVKNLRMTHESYAECLFCGRKTVETMILLRTENHKIRIVQEDRTTQHPFDDARYVLDDKYTTYPYGMHNLALYVRRSVCMCLIH